MARTKPHPNQLNPTVVQNVASAAVLRGGSIKTLAAEVAIAGRDGGIFVRDPTDTTSAEDGGTFCGTIIRPTDYATAGVYKRVMNPLGPFNVLWWGAAGNNSTDDYATIQACFTSVQAYALKQYNGVALHFPAGVYRMSQRATIDLGANQNTGEHGVAIYGDGAGNTLISATPANTTGLFLLTSDGNSELWEVRDMMFASELAANAATNNGTGLHIRSTLTAGQPGYGSHKRHSVRIARLQIGAKAIMGSGLDSRAFAGNFNIGILIENKWFIRCQDVKCTASNLPFDPSTNAPLYTLTGRDAAIRTYNCYSPMFDKIYIDGYFLNGVHVQGRSDDTPSTTDIEDFRLQDSFIVGPNRGFYMEHAAAAEPQSLYEPGGSIVNCHINAYEHGIILRYHRQVVIADCYIYIPQGAGLPNYTGRLAGIWCLGTSDITISAVQFLEPGFYTDDNNCSIGVYCQQVAYVNIIGAHFNCGGVGVFTHGSATGKVTLLAPTYGGQTTGAWATFKKYQDNAGILGFEYLNWDVSGGFAERVVESVRIPAGTSVRSTLRAARTDYASNSNPQLGEQLVYGNSSTGVDRLASSLRTDWETNTNGAETSAYKVFCRVLGSTTQVAAISGDMATDTQTSLLLRVNRGGVYSLSRVTVGATDSGGSGFRVLRVAN